MFSHDMNKAPSVPKVTTSLLKKLSAAVKGQAANATFACGGKISVISAEAEDVKRSEDLFSAPVIIRWDQTGQNSPGKITIPFPSPNSQADSSFEISLPAASQSLSASEVKPS